MAGHARLFVTAALALLVFVGVIALLVFFIALRGAEQVLAPNVQGQDLIEALTELQTKELYPRIQTRYSQNGEDRGTVLEQDPKPGTIVKAGRRVRLVVSQGMVINTIEDYRGRNVEEVRMDLNAFFAAASTPFVTIKEPFMYQYSAEPAGTILEQKPLPGTPVSGPVTLELVVSQGAEHTMVTVPDLAGLDPAAALEKIRETRLGFNFSLRPVRQNEKPGVVVFQEPAQNSPVETKGQINILVSRPGELATGEVFGLFSYTMPLNPYPLLVRLEALPSENEARKLLTEIEFSGGVFTFPYQEFPGTTLILSMMNRELYRETISPSMDKLSLDEI